MQEQREREKNRDGGKQGMTEEEADGGRQTEILIESQTDVIHKEDV